MTEVRATLQDCRKLRYCWTGIKDYCSRNGLDPRELVNSGLKEADLLALGDIYATRLAAAARERVNGKTS